MLAPLQLDSLGVGATAIGAIFLGIGVSEIVVGPVVGRISDRLGVRVPMLYALAATATLLVVLALVGSLGADHRDDRDSSSPSVTAMITPAFTSLGKVAEVYGVASAGVFAAGNLAYASGEGTGALAAGWLEDAGRGDVTYVALAVLALATIAALRSVRHPALGPAGRSADDARVAVGVGDALRGDQHDVGAEEVASSCARAAYGAAPQSPMASPRAARSRIAANEAESLTVTVAWIPCSRSGQAASETSRAVEARHARARRVDRDGLAGAQRSRHAGGGVRLDHDHARVARRAVARRRCGERADARRERGSCRRRPASSANSVA